MEDPVMKGKNVPAEESPKISEMKAFVKEIKTTILEEIEGDQDAQEDGAFILAIIANLEDELKDVKDTKVLEELDLRKQTKLLANLTFLHSMLRAMGLDGSEGFDDEDDLDFDEDEIDEEYDIDEDDVIEDEEDDDTPPKKGKSNVLKF
jgi:hypothetical protein